MVFHEPSGRMPATLVVGRMPSTFRHSVLCLDFSSLLLKQVLVADNVVFETISPRRYRICLLYVAHTAPAFQDFLMLHERELD